MSKELGHHYYAACAVAWCVAPTRDEAIKKLAHADPMIKQGVARKGSFYVWSCRVDVPIDTSYEIEWYKPVDVPLAEAEHGYLTHITTKSVRWLSTTGDVIEHGQS
jgi:hypothetical protein